MKTQFEFPVPTMHRNLKRLLSQASAADMCEGLNWYPSAREGCRVWADNFGVSPAVVANVIAALSPRCDWTANLRIALEVLSGQTTVSSGAFSSNVRKARRIFVDHAETLDGYFDKAPKVRAFAENLKGNDHAVTIDRHALQAALNNPIYARTFHPNRYRIVADCYRNVAEEFLLTPCQAQAVVWCVWKRRYSPAWKRQLVAKGKG